jgi:hypothetical protein
MIPPDFLFNPGTNNIPVAPANLQPIVRDLEVSAPAGNEIENEYIFIKTKLST